MNRFRPGDEVINVTHGWGIVLSGNDNDGYEVWFNDILVPDEFPVHVLRFGVDELSFALTNLKLPIGGFDE